MTQQPSTSQPGGKRSPALLLLFVILPVAILSLAAGLPAARVEAGVMAAPPASTAIVRCEPAHAVGFLGQPLEVDIYIQDIVGLWAGDAQLAFDTSMAQVVDAEPVIPDNGIQIKIIDTFFKPDFIVRRNADNAAGTIWYAASMVKDPPPTRAVAGLPVSGSGPLARITFQGLQTGTFDMPFTYHKFVSNDNIPPERVIEATIPTIAQTCRITFIEPADLTETLFLPVSFAH